MTSVVRSRASIKKKILSEHAENLMNAINAIKEKMNEVKRKSSESSVIEVTSVEELINQINKYIKDYPKLKEDVKIFKILINEGFKYEEGTSLLTHINTDVEKALEIYLNFIDFLGDKNEKIVFTTDISKDIVDRIYDINSKDLPQNPEEYTTEAWKNFANQNRVAGVGLWRDPYTVPNLIQSAKPLKGRELEKVIAGVKEKDKTSRSNPQKVLKVQQDDEKLQKELQKLSPEQQKMLKNLMEKDKTSRSNPQKVLEDQSSYKSLGGRRKTRRRRRRTKKKRRRKRTKKKRKRRRRTRR